MRLLILITFFIGTMSYEHTHARFIEGTDASSPTWRGASEKPVGSRWERLRNRAAEVADRAKERAEEVRSSLAERYDLFRTEEERQIIAEDETVRELISTLPEAQIAEERKAFSEIIQNVEKDIQSEGVLRVAEPGLPASPDLPRTTHGVPHYREEASTKEVAEPQRRDIEVKPIPRLNVGREDRISKRNLVPPGLSVMFKSFEDPKPLKTPIKVADEDILKWTEMKMKKISEWSEPDREKYGLASVVTKEVLEEIPLEMKATLPDEEEKPMHEVDENDLKMLAALKLYEKGDRCHVTVGLFHDLSSVKKYEEDANYYLGICAHKMGFHSESVERLLRVIQSGHSDQKKAAITTLLNDLPKEFDISVYRSLSRPQNLEYIEEESRDSYHYIMSRAAHRLENWSESVRHGGLVKEESPHYKNARFIHAVGLYASQKPREAENAFLALRKWLNDNNVRDSNLQTLISVNLGRIRTLQDRYEAAFEEYKKVDKQHPLWVQALIEQGWAQLSVKDAQGAIGNMYSLHSPFFQAIFKPESWAVRTIGYIDICQYGDAYRALTRTEELHSEHLKSIQAYVKKHSKPQDYYETARKYIRSRSNPEIDGLPGQVIREIARQRGFLNVQEAINNKQDEIEQYDFIYSLIRNDQNALRRRIQLAEERIQTLSENIKRAQVESELAPRLNEWNALRRNEGQLVSNLQFLLAIYEVSRKGYVNKRRDGVARLNQERSQLQVEAGRELQKNLAETKSKLEQILEGNEFLRYEIFAGSGENIRYQAAGGRVEEARRIPANVRPRKILNWQFDGEFWEDEIGSYRSTLRNNCPERQRTLRATSSEGS